MALATQAAFSEAQWRKALEAATKKAPSGFLSRREIVATLGLSRDGSVKFLRKLYEEGKLETQQESRLGFDGRPHPVAVYRLKQ